MKKINKLGIEYIYCVDNKSVLIPFVEYEDGTIASDYKHYMWTKPELWEKLNEKEHYLAGWPEDEVRQNQEFPTVLKEIMQTSIGGFPEDVIKNSTEIHYCSINADRNDFEMAHAILLAICQDLNSNIKDLNETVEITEKKELNRVILKIE